MSHRAQKNKSNFPFQKKSKSRHLSFHVLCAAIFSVKTFPLTAQAAVPDFDYDALRALGLDKDQADKAIYKSQNHIGRKEVGVYLNKKYAGVKELDFNIEACITPALLKELSVKENLMKLKDKTGCAESIGPGDLKQSYDESKNDLYITLPDHYLDDLSTFKNYQSGGFGAFFNYDANSSHSSNNYSSSESLWSQMSLGANINNYLIRTDFSYRSLKSRYTNNSEFQLNSAYVESDFMNAYRVRAGNISVGNALFGAGQVNGFTISNSIGEGNGDSTVNVSGIASEYSKIELHQQGRLIFSRPVPAGDFFFEAVPLHTAYADAELVVVGASGAEQRQIIPKAAFSVNRNMASKFSLFSGQLDSSRSMGSGSVLGAEYQMPFSYYMQPFVGSLLADKYTGIGAGVNFNIIPYYTSGSFSLTGARSGMNGDSGLKFNTQLSTQWSDLNPYFSATLQSRMYRDLGLSHLDQKGVERFSSVKNKYNLTAGISKPVLERLSIGANVSRNTYYGDMANTSLSITSSYSSSNYTLSGNISRNWLSGNQTNNAISPWSSFVTLRIPLNFAGKRGTLSSTVSRYGDVTRYRTGIDQSITDNLTVGAGTEQVQGPANSNRHYAQAWWKTPYANTSWYYSGDDDGSRNYSANLSGSMVTTGRELVLTSEKIRDTFALLDTGVEGFVTVDTPTARIITNHDGKAAIPQLLEGKPNVINIVTKTLPDGAYVKNPREEVLIKRGAVGKVSFASSQERVHLIKLIANKGHFPLGYNIRDSNAEQLGYIVDENILMLNDSGMKRFKQGQIRLTNNLEENCTLDDLSLNAPSAGEITNIKVNCG